MYTLDDLSVMLLSELREIADKIGIKNAKKTAKQDLIYMILDQQATMPEGEIKKIKEADEPKAEPAPEKKSSPKKKPAKSGKAKEESKEKEEEKADEEKAEKPEKSERDAIRQEREAERQEKRRRK